MPIFNQICPLVSEEKIFLSFCFWSPWQPEFCMDLLHLNNFERGPSNDSLCEVLEEMSFKATVDDARRMTDKDRSQ